MNFKEFLPSLKEKWQEIPAGLQVRMFSGDFLQLPETDFIQQWAKLYSENCEGTGFAVRGWYHHLYEPLAKQGGHWLEIGSGLGYDGIFFGSKGAKVTFCDIVEDNLKVVERMCRLKGLTNTDFIVLKSIEEIKNYSSFDVILAIGSLINNPVEIAKAERSAFSNKLKTGGRWLELAYPKERWTADGKLPQKEWGKRTDGERTPWMEWYDLEKLLDTFPANAFTPIMNFNFRGTEFNWFDLMKNCPE